MNEIIASLARTHFQCRSHADRVLTSSALVWFPNVGCRRQRWNVLTRPECVELVALLAVAIVDIINVCTPTRKASSALFLSLSVLCGSLFLCTEKKIFHFILALEVLQDVAVFFVEQFFNIHDRWIQNETFSLNWINRKSSPKHFMHIELQLNFVISKCQVLFKSILRLDDQLEVLTSHSCICAIIADFLVNSIN